MSINTGDKSVRVCFRCDDKLAEWVTSQSAIIGVTPSAFVRQSLYGMMASQQRIVDMMERTVTSEAKSIISSAKAVTREHDSRNQQHLV